MTYPTNSSHMPNFRHSKYWMPKQDSELAEWRVIKCAVLLARLFCQLFKMCFFYFGECIPLFIYIFLFFMHRPWLHRTTIAYKFSLTINANVCGLDKTVWQIRQTVLLLILGTALGSTKITSPCLFKKKNELKVIALMVH